MANNVQAVALLRKFFEEISWIDGLKWEITK